MTAVSPKRKIEAAIGRTWKILGTGMALGANSRSVESGQRPYRGGDTRIDRVDSRIDRLEDKMDGQCKEVNAEFRGVDEKPDLVLLTLAGQGISPSASSSVEGE